MAFAGEMNWRRTTGKLVKQRLRHRQTKHSEPVSEQAAPQTVLCQNNPVPSAHGLP